MSSHGVVQAKTLEHRTALLNIFKFKGAVTTHAQTQKRLWGLACWAGPDHQDIRHQHKLLQGIISCVLIDGYLSPKLAC
eukprot:scaffold9129_cov78-Skeletonema_dohrnii-CCMP3373.AAC.6